MIVGENEVQGQVRRAYERALEAGTTGPLTNRLFGAALATGKRVRTETVLATGPSSLSSVAVELARQVLGDLAHRSVLVLGAGETAELTARSLADRGAEPVSSPRAGISAPWRWQRATPGGRWASTRCRPSSSAPTSWSLPRHRRMRSSDRRSSASSWRRGRAGPC